MLKNHLSRKWHIVAPLSCFLLFANAELLAQMTPDISGVWLATSPRSILTENLPSLTIQAQADFEAFDPLSDPSIRCVMPGFPRSGLIIYPFEVVQTDSMILFLYESFGMVRRIYLDDRKLPDYLPPSRTGYSVGRWEQNELVIETNNFTPMLLDGAGRRQYGDLSVIEHYRLTEEGNLEADVEITAPQTFASPWLRQFTWEPDPQGMIFEAVCDPADSRF